MDWLFRKTICSFLIDRVFSSKTGAVFLSSWFLIFSLSTSVIAEGDYQSDSTDHSPVYTMEDDSWVVNAWTAITLAPDILIIQKLADNFMDDVSGREQGNKWAIGVKWQIDF
jgi:hypothetical protein